MGKGLPPRLGIAGHSNLVWAKGRYSGAWNLEFGDEAMFSEDHLFVVKKSNVETEQFRRETAPGIRHAASWFLARRMTIPLWRLTSFLRVTQSSGAPSPLSRNIRIMALKPKFVDEA